MAVERTRHELFLALEGVLGREEAVTLMEQLPPAGWEDVATKADLADAVSGLACQADLDRLACQADLDHQALDHLLADVGQFRSDMDRRFSEFQEHILTATEASEQRVTATIRGEMVEAMGRQSRLMAFSLVGALTANTGLVLGALRLARDKARVHSPVSLTLARRKRRLHASVGYACRPCATTADAPGPGRTTAPRGHGRRTHTKPAFAGMEAAMPAPTTATLLARQDGPEVSAVE